ncbi:CorA metal ion transporter [Dissophora globulifera]|nr:CorA metal ion transporter [Dissophora globulifera]
MNHPPAQDKGQDLPAANTDTGASQEQHARNATTATTGSSGSGNPADIVISLDQTVPSTPTGVPPPAHYTFPPHNDNTGNDSHSVNYHDQVRRPVSPPFRGELAPPLRYAGHSIRGDYTPSILSGHLSGHQQSSRPYAASIRNEYHPPLGGHRSMDAHHFHRDSSKPLVVDFAGLDASVAAARLLENEYQRHSFAETESASPIGEKAKSGLQQREKGLDRAASTGSSIMMDPSSAPTNGQFEFRRRSARKASFYSERAPRSFHALDDHIAQPPLPESLRYTFYSASTGLIQAPSMPQILSEATIQTEEGTTTPSVFSDLLKDGCYWLDILDPSDFDMDILFKHFHVHPLTIEDISTEEVREKYEVFRHYYFVCFRTFDQDYNSESYLQPASMYSVVFKDGIITFHFRPTNHHISVLRRMEQLHSHITLTPDWINYALLDDITDRFASPIQTIQYEVDSIDELVLLLRESETTDMLRRIGSCRKNVMSLSRLLANKADVVRGLMKRFDERYAVAPLASSSAPVATTTATPSGPPGSAAAINGASATLGAIGSAAALGGTAPSPTPSAMPEDNIGGMIHSQHHRDGEILLYLGDILDHVLTMLQSLWSYEKILDRSHSNYLAQISLEINQLSNKTNEVVGTLTFFASLIVPMTFISGLWGMNVHVPGQPGQDPDEPFTWWWCLIGFMVLYCIVAIFFGKRYGLI